MKVCFGFACRGQADLALDDFPQRIDDLERPGFDSIWPPELMLNGPFDPLVGLAHAAARTERLKLGAYVIVPGRNPVRLARELANLIPRVAALYHRLILVVAPFGAGKTAALQAVAKHTGYHYMKVNLELSRYMLELTQRQRQLQVSRLLQDIVRTSHGQAVLLDNLEILHQS